MQTLKPLAEQLIEAGVEESVAHRFADKVDVRGPDECWPWTAGANERGYGVFGWPSGSSIVASRFSYVHLVGPVDGLDVDHLCRNHPCVNPRHLEAVTHQVNMQRGVKRVRTATHCKHGHEYTPENTGWYTHPRSGRISRKCRECARLSESYRRSRRAPTGRRRVLARWE